MASRVLSNVVCCSKHTKCISNDGDVYVFGEHSSSSSGKEELLSIPKKVEVTSIISISSGAKHSVCLDKYGNVFTFGSNDYGQLGMGNHSI